MVCRFKEKNKEIDDILFKQGSSFYSRYNRIKLTQSTKNPNSLKQLIWRGGQKSFAGRVADLCPTGLTTQILKFCFLAVSIESKIVFASFG